MECKQIERMLDRYIRKELEEDIEKKIQEHLATCEACKEQLRVQETLHCLLTDPVEIKAPSDFTLGIMAKIEKMNKKSGKPYLIYSGWGRSLIAAGILMLIINFVGASKEVNYDQLLYKTSAVQKSIIFSLDEVNRGISRAFNNIDMRIWRD